MTGKSFLFVLLFLEILEPFNSLEVESNDNDNKDSPPVFVPTKEWQKIQPGQSIPPGLHVRVDMQTGIREAKLLDKTDAESSDGTIEVSGNNIPSSHEEEESSHSSSYGHSDRRGIINKATKIFTRKELSEMLKNLRDESPNGEIPLLSGVKGAGPAGAGSGQDGSGKKSDVPHSNTAEFLTMDELKKMVTFHSDVELMLEHIQVLMDPNSTSNATIHSLLELEYYVHQIDNARDFDLLGGLAIVIRFLNNSDSEVQSAAAFTLGAAMQSNPEVQEKALSYRALQRLLDLLVPSSPDILQRRALYALGSLLRGHSLAVKQFILEADGIDLVSDHIHQQSDAVVVKVMTLFTDLLSFEELEEKTSITKRYIESALSTNGWCSHVLRFLHSDAPLKYMEKSVFLMEKLNEVCDFHNSLTQLETLHKELNPNDVCDITETLKGIIDQLKRTKQEL